MHAIAASALVGHAAMTRLTIIWFTTLQERVPRDALSRVSSYDWLGSTLLLPAGLALVGSISAAIGSDSMLLIAACWITASSLATLILPSVRAVRRAADPDAN